jgi:hypothetical protein
MPKAILDPPFTEKKICWDTKLSLLVFPFFFFFKTKKNFTKKKTQRTHVLSFLGKKRSSFVTSHTHM